MASAKSRTFRTAGHGVESLENRTLLSGYTPITLAAFTGSAGPAGPLTMDSAGDLFGLTAQGGTNSAGSIYEVPAGSLTPTTLASFSAPSGQSGASPNPVTVDANGNLFGTTFYGGTNNTGMIYEVATGSGTVTALGSFDAASLDNQTGAYPRGNVYVDNSGDIFGTAEQEGSYVTQVGAGTYWELPAGSSTIQPLSTFQSPIGASLNANPNWTTRDSAGDIFGIAQGDAKLGYNGFVWEIPANGDGVIDTLASFNGTDGSEPFGPIAIDSSGDVFGSTIYGGPGHTPTSETGDGVVWEVQAGSKTVTNLALFNSASTGSQPNGIAMDSSGDIFGTCASGGSGSNAAGTAWELPAGSSTILALQSFGPDITGRSPDGTLILAPNGNLIGTTSSGGDAKGLDGGTIFELVAPGNSLPIPTAQLSPIVASTTLPVSVVSGGTSHGTAAVRITNGGTAAESGVGTVSVYASLDGAIDANSVLLGQVSRNLKIHVASALSVPVPIKSVPFGLDGNYTLLAQTIDANGATAASTSGPQVNIAPSHLAFSESFIKSTLPTNVVSGQATPATEQIKITNGGNIASTGTTTINVYASADGTVSSSTLMVADPIKLNLKPGASKVVTVALKSIPSVTNGTYELVTQVIDPAGNLSSVASPLDYDLSTPNMSYAVTLNYFTPSSLSISTPTPAKFSVTVTNTGNVPVGMRGDPNSIVVAPGLKTVDGTSTYRDMTLVATYNPVLAVGKSVTVVYKFKASLKFSIPISPGSFYVFADVLELNPLDPLVSDPLMTVRSSQMIPITVTA